jgi:hypothetical protein
MGDLSKNRFEELNQLGNAKWSALGLCGPSEGTLDSSTGSSSVESGKQASGLGEFESRRFQFDRDLGSSRSEIPGHGVGAVEC